MNRRKLAWSKMWLTRYLYLLRYKYICNGIFDFRKFRGEAAAFASRFPHATPEVSAAILSAQYFSVIENIFWNLAEIAFVNSRFCYRRDDVDSELESSSAPRTLYITGKIEDVIDSRFGWQKTLTETQEILIDNIKQELGRINDIRGISIPGKVIADASLKIAKAENFETLETAVEDASGAVWDTLEDCIGATCKGLERECYPKYSGDFVQYCRDLEDVVDYCHRHNNSHRAEPEADLSDFYADR